MYPVPVDENPLHAVCFRSSPSKAYIHRAGSLSQEGGDPIFFAVARMSRAPACFPYATVRSERLGCETKLLGERMGVGRRGPALFETQ